MVVVVVVVVVKLIGEIRQFKVKRNNLKGRGRSAQLRMCGQLGIDMKQLANWQKIW